MSASSSEFTETATWLIPQFDTFKTLCVSEVVASRQCAFKKFYFELNIKYISNTHPHPHFIYYFRCRDKVSLKFVKYTLINNNYSTIHHKFYNGTTLQPNLWYDLCTTKKFKKLAEDWNKIVLEFTIINRENTEIAQWQKSEAEQHPNFLQQSRLISDFGNLLRLGTFSDAVIKSTDGVEYKVHKAFLSCRSDVLKAHFDHNTSESDSNILESPFESKVLEEVLTFVYTDQSLKVAEMPEILLNAANFYQLDRLKGLCEEVLYKKLNVENAIEILTLADMHSCKILKKSVMEFIKFNFTLITKTQGWDGINSPEKIKLIIDYVMEKNKK